MQRTNRVEFLCVHIHIQIQFVRACAAILIKIIYDVRFGVIRAHHPGKTDDWTLGAHEIIFIAVIIIIIIRGAEQLRILILSVWCTAVDSRGHYFIIWRRSARKGVARGPAPTIASHHPPRARTQCYQSRSSSATCCKNKKLLADYFAAPSIYMYMRERNMQARREPLPPAASKALGGVCVRLC